MGEFIVIERDRESYAHGDDGDFPLGPDSEVQEGVPAGTIVAGHLDPGPGAVWPHTSHDYWIYTPAGHDPTRPADVLVGLDGLPMADSVHLTTVLDNLITRGELPPIVAVLVSSGPEGDGYPIYGGLGNRCTEYDVIGPDLPRFLLDELLPVVERTVALTDDPERRGIFGMSSGGAAAFTVAWERPDSFRRVLSGIGSFVNIGGAHQYPSMIRRAERKPIRVLLQGGTNDLDTIFGHWPIANQDMAAALEYRDYDYRFEFGDGGHGGKHIASILPDALRWLWRD